jgi:glycosyltransferase involved in cell wall biosynthesis
MPRLLYILWGLVPPGADPARDKFSYLSEIAEGDILLPVWWSSPDEAPPFLRETFPVYRVGRFKYHLFLSWRFPQPLRKIATFFYYLRRGLQLHREKKFDAIMTYGTNTTGIAGVFLKWLTGAKLIIEIPGVPENAFRYDTPNPGYGTIVKRFFADQLLLFEGAAADCMKLLYPWQLQKYPRLRRKRVAVFHDFVPVHAVGQGESEERFVLSVGYPWYTKGMDVLIEAFKSIAPEFPNYNLKLMGYYPDREYLDQLAGGCPQIEFLKAGPNEVAIKWISTCSVFVLASLTDSMGRVLLEAMAARKPIIASAVGGVPHYIRDGDNGLLFQSENVDDLAAKLTEVMSSQELQARLGKRGHEKVFSEFDEQAYVRAFHSMLQSVSEDSGK